MLSKGVVVCLANWTGPKSLIFLLGIKHTETQRLGSRDFDALVP